MKDRVSIIGAGVAGLSCAVRLAQAGRKITVFEASPYAGGRCRSFHDQGLDALIDNGAHLMLSGNTDILAYLDLIGARDQVMASERARFEFLDVEFDHAWAIDLAAGQGIGSVIKWIFDATRRPPNVGPWTLMRDVLALKMSQGKTVAACLDINRPHFRTFWEPLCVGVMNAPPNEAAAELLWAVFEETVLLGGSFARPMLTRNGLGAALVDPALNTLAQANVDVKLAQRVRSLDFKKGRVSGLVLAQGAEVLGEHDQVVLAVPHMAVAGLIHDMTAPQASHAIVNVHYRLKSPQKSALKGAVGSPVQWVFTRGHIASVTMSAADGWVDKDADEIARALWPDVVKILALETTAMPAYRVIKERRATFAQSPDAIAQRPGTQTKYENLYLAGDWTNTGLPATLEGAIRSGRKAAEAVLGNGKLDRE